VKASQVRGLVRLHVGELAGDAALGASRAQHRALTAIDVHRAQLARVVDPQDLGQALPDGAGAGPGRDGFGRMRLGRHRADLSRTAAMTLKAASASEISTFHPAMERPAKTQAASSQAGGRILSPASSPAMASALTAPPPEAQAVGPGHHFHSTPA